MSHLIVYLIPVEKYYDFCHQNFILKEDFYIKTNNFIEQAHEHQALCITSL